MEWIHQWKIWKLVEAFVRFVMIIWKMLQCCIVSTSFAKNVLQLRQTASLSRPALQIFTILRLSFTFFRQSEWREGRHLPSCLFRNTWRGKLYSLAATKFFSARSFDGSEMRRRWENSEITDRTPKSTHLSPPPSCATSHFPMRKWQPFKESSTCQKLIYGGNGIYVKISHVTPKSRR